MAVNLLPQTPPRNPAEARGTPNVDAPADDASSFAASLTLAKAADAAPAGKPATRAADSASESDAAPQASSSTAPADDLAAWVLANTGAGLLAGAVAPAVPPETPSTALEAGAASDAHPEAVPTAPVDVLAASLALLKATPSAPPADSPTRRPSSPTALRSSIRAGWGSAPPPSLPKQRLQRAGPPILRPGRQRTCEASPPPWARRRPRKRPARAWTSPPMPTPNPNPTRTPAR